MRIVHDETLADLAHITAKVNITRAQASEKNPMLATITIEPRILFAILTAAALYHYDNPAKFDPEFYEENQDWHDLQLDTIRALEGRLSVACDPKYGRSKDQTIAQDRHFRRLEQEQIASGIRPAPTIEENPPETMQDLKNKIVELESKLARAKAALA